ncbi:MAG: ABC transporter substrate-binding protein [Spirochaetaceae bacterium]
MKRLALLVLLLLPLTLAFGSGQTEESDTITIGGILDLSGPTSVWGNAVANGAELAVDQINADGGIGGRQLELKVYDVKLSPQEAISAYNRLVDQDRATAVVGPPISNIGLSIAPVTESKGVPVVGSFIDPRATTKENGEPWQNMFLMQPSSVQYSEIIADFALQELDLENIAIMYDQSNAFSVSLVEPFRAYVNEQGGEVAIEVTYKAEDKDFRTQLSQIKQSGADGVYLPIYVQEAVLTLQQAQEVGLDIPIIGGLDFAPPFTSLLPDGELADGIYVANNYSESEPQLKDVREAYMEKFGEEPINKAYLGYDKVLIIADAIRRADSSDPQAVSEAIESTENLRATTGVITISDETHQPVGLSMVMYQIQDGEYEEIGRHVPASHQ